MNADTTNDVNDANDTQAAQTTPARPGLENAYVITSGGERLNQFRAVMRAAFGDVADAIREWRWCPIEGSQDDHSMGNSIAHYSLVRHALEARLPCLVVFEDDAVPSDDAPAELARILQAREGKCAILGWTYDSDSDAGRDISEHRRVYGSHAYALFGEEAYLAYMDAWERKNGRADRVLALLPDTALAGRSLFSQFTPKGTASIHLPAGWSADAQIEAALDAEGTDRYAAARRALAERQAARTIHVAYCVDVPNAGGGQFVDQLRVSLHTLKVTARVANVPVMAHVFYSNVPAGLVEALYKMRGQGRDAGARLSGLQEDFDIEVSAIPGNLMGLFNRFSKPAAPGPGRSWTGIVYARLWLPGLLPGLSRVIYLDADTMVRGSLKELWDTDLEGAYFGMVQGTIPEYGFNSGVMLMDLEGLRKDQDLARQLLPFMDKHAKSFYCPDQTVINRFYGPAGKIKELPIKWNYGPMQGRVADPDMGNAVVWHFYNGHQKPYRLATDDFGAGLLEWNKWLANLEGRKGL